MPAPLKPVFDIFINKPKGAKQTIMKNLEFTGDYFGEKITIKQVQKRTARKLFDAGETIFLQSSNFLPFGVWATCHAINKDGAPSDSFDAIVNNFEYYNCSNRETGLYTTFYRRVT